MCRGYWGRRRKEFEYIPGCDGFHVSGNCTKNEQRLWYESQEENLAYYENQAAEENEQAKQIIAENEKAVTEQPVQQESQNVDETPTQKESKKPEKKTENFREKSFCQPQKTAGF